jgi:hypothetical protein
MLSWLQANLADMGISRSPHRYLPAISLSLWVGVILRIFFHIDSKYQTCKFLPLSVHHLDETVHVSLCTSALESESNEGTSIV